MAYTLRGRLDSRLAAALAPLLAACVLALALQAWWPFELAALMLAVGLALEALALPPPPSVPARLGRAAARAP